jgi:hypothetical protein
MLQSVQLFPQDLLKALVSPSEEHDIVGLNGGSSCMFGKRLQVDGGIP